MKRYSTVILPAALDDIREAKNWYNEQQPGLGARFTKAVRALVKRVARYPHHYAVRYSQTRMAQLTVFPYLIHYYIDEARTSVVIIAILSASRDPKVWETRL
ncbi:type II toxin-antitoxin system RelE/ParE family toxin [Parapedobacter soli]|uniref:type II toxin-antitoxin system RelE/ParE family toxin n=1 Tax=Parapedobacter soli TaxID=416955 RepID=UPI0036F36CF7